MHRDAAGMAIETPTTMRVAIVIISVVARTKEKVGKRTYVAPMREHINRIITPDD